MPTRVLDLEAFANSDDIRLVIPDSQSVTDYVALSWCWGPPEKHSLQTTPNTLQERLNRIVFSSLSLTFQDAIRTTRGLGIRFLWIDSLCIIQQNTRDFAEQSSQMAKVYKNALCTIAALSASDGTEGCRVGTKCHADSHRGKPMTLDLPYGDKIVRILSKFRSWNYEYGIDDRSFCQNPLRDRAWALQERLLSTRSVIYSMHKLLWECKTIKGTVEIPWEAGIDYTPLKEEPMPLAADEDRSRTGPVFQRDRWYSIVEEYSMRNMTNESEKLPALSGVASQFQSDSNAGTYHAGLWSSHIPSALLWQSVPGRSNSRGPVPSIPVEWRAPSWSWVSVNGRITYECQRFQSEAGITPYPPPTYDYQITDTTCTTTPATSDAFGMVRPGAELTVRGRLLRCWPSVPKPWSFMDGNLAALSLQPGWMTCGALLLDPDTNSRHGELEERYARRIEALGRVYFLPVRNEPDFTVDDTPKRLGLDSEKSISGNGIIKVRLPTDLYMGLALVSEAEEVDCRRYRRVGLVRWFKVDGSAEEKRGLVTIV